MAGRFATTTYEIKKKPIPVPTLRNTEVDYTGQLISPGWDNYNENQIIGEFMNGVDSRDYTASFRPAADYCWSDGSTSTKTAHWKIKAIEGPVVVPLPTVPVGPNTTAQEFYSYVKSGQLNNYAVVGDAVTIPLSGTFGSCTVDGDYLFNILGFNHNQPLEGDGSYVDLCLRGPADAGKECAFSNFTMNASNTNTGGWAGSLMFGTCGEFYRVIDPVWQALIILATKYTDNVGGGSSTNVEASVTSTQSKIWLLSEFEVFGQGKYANNYEQNYQAMYDLYKNGGPRVRYDCTKLTTALRWWLRSRNGNNSSNFCSVSTDGGAGNSNADSAYGFAPGFRIG